MALKIPEKPIEVLPARIWRTYSGGRLLDEFHNLPVSSDSNKPEEWILSTMEARNMDDQRGQGKSRLVFGSKTMDLQDFIEQNPAQVLGKRHAQRYDTQLALLVGLIDSAERLTIQVHPSRENARKYFGTSFGKTESWYIMGLREEMDEPNHIYIGFRPGVTYEDWKRCFEAQDYLKMLSMLHKIPVKVGETYIINSGVPHAIGAGCFILELQEPNDYTLRVEKITPQGFEIDEFMCHQGIGYDNMLNCFDYCGVSEEEALLRLRTQPSEIETSPGYSIRRLIGHSDTTCFGLDEIVVNSRATFGQHDAYYGLFVLGGSGEIIAEDSAFPIKQGQAFFVPAVCPGFELLSSSQSPLRVMRYFGPDV